MCSSYWDFLLVVVVVVVVAAAIVASLTLVAFIRSIKFSLHFFNVFSSTIFAVEHITHTPHISQTDVSLYNATWLPATHSLESWLFIRCLFYMAWHWLLFKWFPLRMPLLWTGCRSAGLSSCRASSMLAKPWYPWKAIDCQLLLFYYFLVVLLCYLLPASSLCRLCHWLRLLAFQLLRCSVCQPLCLLLFLLSLCCMQLVINIAVAPCFASNAINIC